MKNNTIYRAYIFVVAYMIMMSRMNDGDSVNNESAGRVVYRITSSHDTLCDAKTMDFYNLIGCCQRYDDVTAKSYHH